METERVRGNSAGITHEHVAANLRAARQAIGMDVRTAARRMTDAGRKIAPSGISKIENGDRRVDVDDLTALAYVLNTTPAALLTPPAEAVTLSGVPETFLPEEVQVWIAGGVKLTTDDLVRYWKEQRFQAISSAHWAEEMLAKYDRGQVGVTPREVYQERYDAQSAREADATGRLLQLDPNASLAFE
ncbi:helix-turn-helix transcriptional regulator [Microbacterium sp. STN6]|uniref:helix-turn-helix domain-containing protein n=1 Tax=Microbacterium sp. STN6 TaxID=2995588 RepID=UPI002260D124|nr:helix-turn-helix transcriptional regulator [Microbacterium sp. STN6]MCX7522734.1 helix-turn-helix transcriptional regulator [Microbacterium sp. STN6]